jgi:hypothetical protein
MAQDRITNEDRTLFDEMGATAVRAKAEIGGFDVSQLIAAHLWLEENDKKSAAATQWLTMAAVAIAAFIWFVTTYKT